MIRRRQLHAWRIAASLLFGLAFSGRASAQNMPEWLERDQEAWAGRREPQIPDPQRVFRAARPLDAESLDRAMLLCFIAASEPSADSRAGWLRGVVPRRWDAFGDPDLRIVVNVGARRSVIWGHENARGHYFSVPAVTLRRGQRFTLTVADRDVTTLEPIGRVGARYQGRLPLELRARWLEGQCRAAPASLVAERVAAALQRATISIEVIEHAAPSIDAPDLARPTSAAAHARAGLLEAAAWTGWRDTSVRSGRERFDAAERAFDGRLREVIAQAHHAAPRVGEPATLPAGVVRVRAFACGARARALAPEGDRASGRCVVQLEVSATEDAPPAWLGTPDVVDARGTVHTASGARFVERVDEASIRVVLMLAGPLDARGAVLRVGRARLRIG